MDKKARAKQHRQLPASHGLEPTLSRRVFQLRELRNMTVLDLAKLARFPVSRIEDIESGLETWLSSADRQRLAKALAVEPRVIEEVEIRRFAADSAEFVLAMENLAVAVLAGKKDLPCPQCGRPLVCRIQEGLDLEGMPITFAKAFCTRCPFVLR